MRSRGERAAGVTGTPRRRSRWPFAALAALPLLFGGAAQAAGLTPEEAAGKRVFLDGVGASGIPIQALVGPHATPISGEALPCASCHGPDGLGRPEGAVRPSNITWAELTKPYGHRFENGRERGPYDEKSFFEAVTFGTDASGNRLDTSMPRYVMANADLASLLAYLKRIGSDFDPGIHGDRLRIGTLLPASGRMAEVGRAMREVMQRHLEQINGQGGIFGRRLDLVVGELPEDRALAAQVAERLMQEGDVFALVSPFALGIERALFDAAEAARVPVVGPFTLSPEDGGAVNRQTFFLLPGPADQARALAEFAYRDLGLDNPQVAIVAPDSAPGSEVAEAIADRLAERQWTRVSVVRYARPLAGADRLVGGLQQQGVQAIFFLGDDAELRLIGGAIRDAIWSPYLLALGAQVGQAAVNLPTTFGNRVFLAYPTLPGDITEAGAAALAGGPPGGAERTRHQPARVAALGAMRVLDEGLRRAGRDLSRVKFTAALEKLFSFETGVTPTISYGPGRRVGALGAHIVAVDLATHRFRPTGRYLRAD